jgi:hypothetical protein
MRQQPPIIKLKAHSKTLFLGVVAILGCQSCKSEIRSSRTDTHSSDSSTKISTSAASLGDGVNALKIYTGEPADVCSSQQYMDKNGDTQTGTKNCASGTVTDCTSEGQTDCKNTAAYISVDVTKVIPGNIKFGVTLGGVVGSYPSSTYPLTGATSTTDLSDFTTQLTSDGTFEFWDSAGNRRTGSGDSDIVAANIKSGITMENLSVTGTAVVPNVWDVRVGTSVGATTGLLKLNCRNGANLSYFDLEDYPKTAVTDGTTDTFTITSHGYANNQKIKIYFSTMPMGLDSSTIYYVRNATANTFQVALTSGGTPIDISAAGLSVSAYKYGNTVTEIWDSIDDYYGAATAIPTYSGWSTANMCGGIEVSTDDANVWKDVTTTGDGVTLSTCTATPAHCSFKDKISGQEWHKSDVTDRNWSTALSFCDSLSYNGKTDWRLPTVKELMDAYTHGMVSTAGYTNWITLANFQQNYWSASTRSSNIYLAHYMSFGSHTVASTYKSTLSRSICVRP